MSNIIPPLVSSSPPPMVVGEPDDLDDDEFGDFAAATDLSSFEGYSLPTTPQHASIPIQTQNFISTNNQMKINNVSEICNGEIIHSINNHIEETTNYNIRVNSTDDNNSENIFCDINSDVNINKNEKQDDIKTTSIVQNVDSECIVVPRSNNIQPENQNDSETTETEHLHDHCDKRKDEETSAINEETKIDSQIPQQQDDDDEDDDDDHIQNIPEDEFNDFNCFTSFESTDEAKQIEPIKIIESSTESIENNNCSSSCSNNKNVDNLFNVNNNKQATVFNECEEPNTDDFGEFNDCTSTIIETLPESTQTQSEEEIDEFGDFNDYSSVQEATSIEFVANFDDITTDPSQNAEEIIKDVFTGEEVPRPECERIDFMDNDVFKLVQDIENTNALRYHWANSESQKFLLKALNIDARNILFGPRWNLSMPRFAANLGFTPLEPVKSELPSASSPQAVTTTTPTPSQPEQASCDVPDAKFDWNSSGLVNPLDYSQANTMLLDLEQLVPSLDIPHITLSSSHQQQQQQQQQTIDPLSLDLDSWDFWLQTQNEQPVKLETIEEKLNVSNQLGIVQLDVLNNFGSDSESVNSLKFIEASADIEIDNNQTNEKLTNNQLEPEPDEDFTSFQTSNIIPVKVPLRETHIAVVPNNNLVEHNPVYNLESFELESTIDLSVAVNNEEDDFTDFQMSLPQVEKKKSVVSLEPLKPIVVETAVNNAPAQINWPEPGIVSDDLKQFEFNFIGIKQEEAILTSQQVTAATTTTTTTTKTTITTTATSEEDDWSDFVCAQETIKMDLPKAMTPQHSYQNPNPSNFSNLFPNNNNINNNKQLELSVPNLQNTQLSHTTVLPPTFMPNTSPTKSLSTQQLAAQQISFGYQPPYQIPLQTINTPFGVGGLPQTSLSTYNNFTIGPTELSSSQIPSSQTKPSPTISLFDGPFNSEMKPFQSYNSPPQQTTPESHCQYQIPTTTYQLNSVESTFLKMQPIEQEHPKNYLGDDDDDDWTDFVSSQPVPSSNTTINGLPNLKPIAMANNFTPNIIANPVHFEAFQSYQTDSSSMKLNKNSVPSISALPELDFIAPKNKFFTKK